MLSGIKSLVNNFNRLIIKRAWFYHCLVLCHICSSLSSDKESLEFYSDCVLEMIPKPGFGLTLVGGYVYNVYEKDFAPLCQVASQRKLQRKQM